MADQERNNLDSQETQFECACEKWAYNDGYYGIGSTTPPKDYIGAMSLMLVLVVGVCSFVSVLSLMGIRMTMAATVPTEESISVSFHVSGDGALSVGLENTGPMEESTAPTTEPIQIAVGQAGMQNHGTLEGDSDLNPDPTGVLSWQQVYDKVIPSVVSISCTGTRAAASGTGVIIHTEGYIITNAHVVENADSVQVLLTDGRTFEAQCVGQDGASDLAVLKIEAQGLTAAEFGDSAVLRVGDQVVAIGDPLGVELRGTMTDGIISGINRDITIKGRVMSVIQTTAALNEGNSGGPLVNCYGQVIGINTMKIGDYASESGVEGIGFAIPTSTVKTVVEQLLRAGTASGRPDLGVEGKAVSNFYQFYYRLPSGMLITGVDEQSDAWLKGVEEGDILLSVDDVRITGWNSYEELMRTCHVGQEVMVKIYREGRQIEANITLGEHNNN